MEHWLRPPTDVRASLRWRRFWSGAAIGGAVFSPLLLGAATAVMTWMAGFVMAMIVSGLLAPVGTTFDWKSASRTSVLWGAVLPALAAGIQVVGPAALGVPVVAALTLPSVIRGVRRRVSRGAVLENPGANGVRPPEHDLLSGSGHPANSSRPPVPRFTPIDVSPAGVAGMDSDRLCRAWRSSFLGLEAARSTMEVLDAVRVRQVLLDELHRRHLPEVRAWIAAGGRAASGPERFLGPATRRTEP
jgi:hypothetical protein